METKLNSGAIFKNAKKTTDKQPDYNGTVNVNGKEMQIALWLKKSKTGMQYFSAAFSEPYSKKEIANQNNTQDLIDNDLPF